MSKISQIAARPARWQSGSLVLTALISAFVALKGPFVPLKGPNGPLYVVQDQVVAVARSKGVGACETVIFTTASNPLYVCDSPEQVIKELENKTQTEQL